jgi:hypothetical protein
MQNASYREQCENTSNGEQYKYPLQGTIKKNTTNRNNSKILGIGNQQLQWTLQT